MNKILTVLLLSAAPAAAAEFELNKASIPALRETPGAEAPAPVTAEPKPCKMPGPGASVAEIIAWIRCVELPPPPPAPADKLFGSKALCRGALLGMMNQPADLPAGEAKSLFEGANAADGKACRMELSYTETAERKGNVYVYAPDSLMDPFNHYVTASEEPAACSAGDAFVSARHSWRQDSGWHHKFTTELAIRKLQDGLLEIAYRQDKGETLTCVGKLRPAAVAEKGLPSNPGLALAAIARLDQAAPRLLALSAQVSAVPQAPQPYAGGLAETALDVSERVPALRLAFQRADMQTVVLELRGLERAARELRRLTALIGNSPEFAALKGAEVNALASELDNSLALLRAALGGLGQP